MAFQDGPKPAGLGTSPVAPGLGKTPALRINADGEYEVIPQAKYFATNVETGWRVNGLTRPDLKLIIVPDL